MRNKKMLTGMLATMLSVSMVLSSAGIVKAQEMEQTTEVLETVVESQSEEIGTQVETETAEEVVTKEISMETKTDEIVVEESSTETSEEAATEEETSVDAVDETTNDFVIEDGVLVEYKGNAEKVVIPNDVTEIGAFSFEYCDTIKEVIIPDGVTLIGWGAFSDCSSLEKVVMSDSVTAIEEFVFYGCSNLSEIVFSKNLVEFADNTLRFDGTKWLENQMVQNELVIVNDYLIAVGTATGKVIIPNEVKTIGDWAFSDREDIGEIIIPSSVEYIGEDAFIGTTWLENEKKKTDLLIINNIVVNGQNCEGIVKLPKGTRYIAGGAFADCMGLTEIIMPNGLKAIGERAFSGCEKLTKAVIPPSVMDLGMDEQWGESTFIALDKLTIYGASGSYAEKIATGWENIPFVAISFEDEDNSSDNNETDNDTEDDNTSDTTKPEESFDATLDKNIVTEKVAEIKSAKENANIIIDMKNKDGKTATVIPVELLEVAKVKKVNVILNMGGYTWTIQGTDIHEENLEAINLEVKLNSNTIPSEKVKELAKDNKTHQISLTHNGEFGFKAVLTVNVGDTYKGQNASLYYYNNGKFVFQDKCLIANNGYAEFAFSHASDYVIIIEEDNVTEDETNKDESTENKNESPKTSDGNNMYIWFVLLSGVGLVFSRKMMERKITKL